MRKHGTSIVVFLYVAAILSGCFGNIRQNEDISKEGESKSESYPELAAVLTEFTSDMTWETSPTLDYGTRWTFYVEDNIPVSPEQEQNYGRGVATKVMVRDNTTGESVALTELLPANTPFVCLYPFTDILGCDGVVFEYGVGAASSPVLFFRVEDDAVNLIAECDGFIYTGDPDGNGERELIYSTYGAFPSTFAYWLDAQKNPVSASLDTAAKEILSQTVPNFPVDADVMLELQGGSGQVKVIWQQPPGRGNPQSQELEIGVLFQNAINDAGALATVYDYIEAMNSKNWDKYISLSPSSEYNNLMELLFNEKYVAENLGVHTVISAEIVDVRTLNPADIPQYILVEDIAGEAPQENVKAYLVATDLRVKEETKYHHNGINMFTVLIARESGVWKVFAFSVASAGTISNTYSNYGSAGKFDVNKLAIYA